MPSRSAPTATTRAPYAGSAHASSRAWRLVPEPETRTTRRAGAGVGHLSTLSPGRPGPATGHSAHAPASGRPGLAGRRALAAPCRATGATRASVPAARGSCGHAAAPIVAETATTAVATRRPRATATGPISDSRPSPSEPPETRPSSAQHQRRRPGRRARGRAEQQRPRWRGRRPPAGVERTAAAGCSSQPATMAGERPAPRAATRRPAPIGPFGSPASSGSGGQRPDGHLGDA